MISLVASAGLSGAYIPIYYVVRVRFIYTHVEGVYYNNNTFIDRTLQKCESCCSSIMFYPTIAYIMLINRTRE